MYLDRAAVYPPAPSPHQADLYDVKMPTNWGSYMKYRSTHLSRKALATAVLLASTGAYAQIEEIVITAELRETNVQQTPLAVTAVSSEMLEARNQTNIFQVSQQAPNVTLTPAGMANGPAMLAYIRGVGQTDFNYAVEPGVGVYVDDVYFPTLTGSMIELLDLNRVEILRGPQGTLAGRNAIGGFVKLYSQKPDAEDSGRFSITTGSYERLDVNGMANFAITDNLFARFAGVSKTEDGYVDRLDYRCASGDTNFPTFIAGGDLGGCKIGTEGGRSMTSVRAAFLWEASDDVEVNLVYDNTNEDSEPPAGVLLQVNEAANRTNGYGAGTFVTGIDGTRQYYDNRFVTHGAYRRPGSLDNPYATYSTYLDPQTDPLSPTAAFSPGGISPIQTLNQQGVSLTVDWSLSDTLSFKSITAVREYEADWAQDADASPINSQQLIQRLEHDQITQEFRLNGVAFNDKLEYTLGTFWFDQDGILEANVNLAYAGLNFIHGPDETPAQARAVFANGVYHLTDNMNLSLGLRYSEDEKDYVFRRRNPDGTIPVPCTVAGPPASVGNPPNCALAGLFNQAAHFEDERTDYRVALDYNFTDDLMGYAQVSTGYKAGGINPRPFFIVQIQNVAPEEVTAYEVGLKSVLFDRRMRLNMAYFFNDYTDIQLGQNQCEVPFPPFFGAPCLKPANAGDADVTGFEVEAELDLDNWIIDASLSTLDFEYTRVDPTTPVTMNMTTPFTPELKYSLGAQYTHDMMDNGTLTGRLDLSFQDDIFANPVNADTNRIDSYTLLNGRLTWRNADQDWEMALEGNNLTDEVYYMAIFDQYLSSGSVTATIAKPRTFAVTLKHNFQ